VSDTVVLNHSSWGRPQRIARSRAPEGFQETWTYAARSGADARILRFLNGHLVAIDVEVPPVLAARTPSGSGTENVASGTATVEWRNRPTWTELDLPVPVHSEDSSYRGEEPI